MAWSAAVPHSRLFTCALCSIAMPPMNTSMITCITGRKLPVCDGAVQGKKASAVSADVAESHRRHDPRDVAEKLNIDGASYRCARQRNTSKAHGGDFVSRDWSTDLVTIEADEATANNRSRDPCRSSSAVKYPPLKQAPRLRLHRLSPYNTSSFSDSIQPLHIYGTLHPVDIAEHGAAVSLSCYASPLPVTRGTTVPQRNPHLYPP